MPRPRRSSTPRSRPTRTTPKRTTAPAMANLNLGKFEDAVDGVRGLPEGAPTGPYAEGSRRTQHRRVQEVTALERDESSDLTEAIAVNLAAVRARVARAAAACGRPADQRPPGRGLEDLRRRRHSRGDRRRSARLRREQGPGSPPQDRSASRPSDDLRWHLIGHLQSNKARKAARPFDVDPLDRLARPAAARSTRPRPTAHRRPQLLLQVDLAGEATKHGAAPDELRRMLDGRRHRLRAATIAGLMADSALSRRSRSRPPVLPPPARAARRACSPKASSPPCCASSRWA